MPPCSDFWVILKELQWPFTTSAVSSKALEAWNKNKKRFTEVFDLLIELDEGGSPTHSTATVLLGDPGSPTHSAATVLLGDPGSPTHSAATVLLGDPLLKPLELLVQPLRKRFKYHFFGERKTKRKFKKTLRKQRKKLKTPKTL